MGMTAPATDPTAHAAHGAGRRAIAAVGRVTRSLFEQIGGGGRFVMATARALSLTTPTLMPLLAFC